MPKQPETAGSKKVRLRTARAQGKARDQLRELLRDTSLIQTLVIARNAKDEWTVLVGGLRAQEVGGALVVGAETLDILIEHENKVDGGNGPVRLDFSAPVEGPPGERLGRKRVPEVTKDAEGNLISPTGEAWMSCAECGCNRWFVTVREDGAPGRQACIRCGNEIVQLQMQHTEGRA